MMRAEDEGDRLGGVAGQEDHGAGSNQQHHDRRQRQQKSPHRNPPVPMPPVYSSSLSGISTRNTVPLSLVEARTMSPPWARARSRAMARPRPEPPARAAVAKGWNSRACRASGMPGPVVGDLEHDALADALRLGADAPGTALPHQRLHRVADEVQHQAVKLLRIGIDLERRVDLVGERNLDRGDARLDGGVGRLGDQGARAARICAAAGARRRGHSAACWWRATPPGRSRRRGAAPAS